LGWLMLFLAIPPYFASIFLSTHIISSLEQLLGHDQPRTINAAVVGHSFSGWTY